MKYPLTLLAAWLVGLATAATSQATATLTLAEGGQSPYRIVIATNPPASTRYAAEELQAYLEKITGARLPIALDSAPAQEHEIWVGPSKRFAELGLEIDFPSLAPEGHVLQTAGSRLVIAGGEPRGTLYGVYGLLEDHFGCRWFTPEMERIPKRPKLSLPPLDEKRLPVFNYRETYTWEAFDGNWMARNRLNGTGGRGRLLEKQGVRPPVPEIDERHGGSIRFGFGFFVHNMEKIVPADRYFAAHLEYFALWKDKRDPAQVCCSNEEVLRLCTEGVLAGMRQQPDATVFSLSQNDNGKYCQCERCTALVEAEGTKMGPLLHLVNRVAEVAGKQFPNKLVETLAYQWSRQPPKLLRPLPNVVIRLCDIECCFAHPLASGCTDRNKAFVADLQAWSKICSRLWIWDYTTNYRHYLLPMPNKRVLAENIRLFAENHVPGVFEQGTYDTWDSEFVALKAWLIAKFLWNPQADAQAAISEFLSAYYGPAASKVRESIDLLHDFAEKNQIHVGIYAAATSPHLPPALLAQANLIWAAAETAASGQADVLDRVRRSRMSVDYAIVEQGRAAAKVPEPKRTQTQCEILALARQRYVSFLQTLTASKLTRLQEWKDVNKTEYRMVLAADLGIPPDESLRQEAHRKAKQFMEEETQFHLGVLPTEQSNPKTTGLAEMAQKDLPAAIRMLQTVDADIPPKATQLFAGPEYRLLVESLERTLAHGGRICFSGCGATGRLSILLEATWRNACQDLKAKHPAQTAELTSLENQVVSLMTGGDFALIRSVENFEDYATFGRRQVQELGLGKGDALVAISEGGETFSVIGTIGQALENGAEAFFLFNNPASVLAQHIERSRQVIEDPRVTKLDLSTGPMAVAGSTRMQATTSELLVAGAALETAFASALRTRLNLSVPTPADYAGEFSRLLNDLSQPDSIAAIAAMVACEENLYRRKGLVTYLADRCLLDIFTDTTERSPTFMLPRFRKSDDQVSPPSWAFVKSPLLSTPETWRSVLRREPRCLTWTLENYREMKAPPTLQQKPPRLSAEEMFKFAIGNEDDPSRRSPSANAAILVALSDEIEPLRAPFADFAKPFADRAVLAIGLTAPPPGLGSAVWHVPARTWTSPLALGDRIAVKLVLNTVSTATMARMGRMQSNWMVHVEPTNKKLIDRGTRLVSELTGVDYRTACYALHETIEDLNRTILPGQEKPSPVALTIARLKRN